MGRELGFGIGEHAPERVLSLVMGGQQPYEWPDSPLTRVVTRGLAACRTNDAEGLVAAFETFWDVRFPDDLRARWVANDPAALQAAWTTALSEGPISDDLSEWEVSCLLFLGAGDHDFLDQARRAATEIPNAELLVLEEADHYGAHTSHETVLVERVLETLRASQ